jgi:hypothetical protein
MLRIQFSSCQTTSRSCHPYAPELNSTENIAEYLRRVRLSHRVWDTYKAILDACCDAWNALIAAVSSFPAPLCDLTLSNSQGKGGLFRRGLSDV